MTKELDLIVEKFYTDFINSKSEDINPSEHWEKISKSLLKYLIYRNEKISPERTSRGRIKKTVEYLQEEFKNLKVKMIYNGEGLEEKEYQLNFPLNKTGKLIINSEKEISQLEKSILYLIADTLNIHIKNANDYEKNEEAAMQDSLTGLYNKGFFKKMLEIELNQEIKSPDKGISLIYLDLDNFKKYNDENGHPAGDTLLQELGYILKKTTNDTDIKCRIGGEEFAIIMPRTRLESAKNKVEDIQRYMAMKFSKKPVTASIGIIHLPTEADSIEDAVKRVDEALYISKYTGKNKATVYDREEIENFKSGLTVLS